MSAAKTSSLEARTELAAAGKDNAGARKACQAAEAWREVEPGMMSAGPELAKYWSKIALMVVSPLTVPVSPPACRAGRGHHRRPERGAHHQRAHRRRHRLRPGQEGGWASAGLRGPNGWLCGDVFCGASRLDSPAV